MRFIILLLAALFTSCHNQYDFYIASTGSDKNSGKSITRPLRSIATLETKALTFGNGVKIKFLDEYVYRESLDLSGLDGIVLDGNFSTLSASDVVPKNAELWKQWDALHFPNIWFINWSFSEKMMGGASMTIDRKMPAFVNQIEACNATENSFSVSGGTLQDSMKFFIHSNTDPNTNQHVYEIMKRPFGLKTQHRASISNLVTHTGTHNDGSLSVSDRAVLRNLLSANGHKHNLFHTSGLLEDCVVFDWQYFAGQTPFIAYGFSLKGKQVTYKRCLIVAPEFRGEGTGFYAHAADNSFHTSFEIDGCIAYNVNSLSSIKATGKQVIQNSYQYGAGGQSADGGDLLIERTLFKINGSANSGITSAGGSTLFRNDAFYGLKMNGPFRLNKGLITFQNCSFVTDSADQLFVEGPVNATDIPLLKYNKCLFIKASDWPDFTDIHEGQKIESDYNVFYTGDDVKHFPGNIKEKGKLNTLARWQQQTGQDIHSVFLTRAQRATFFLGDPAKGDFRINPDAEVTAANGKAYKGTFPDGIPITLAGVQEHYDFNTRVILKTAPLQFPMPPITYHDCVKYIKDPTGWDFYK
ncbi:MAG: hypothetical protein H7Y07_16525 [Pyrinomonadaceae bacterium]|nr:hypothetical protein [Sphingobacteriaceae bacterium]